MTFVILGDIGRRHLYHVGDEAMTDVAIDMLETRGVTDVTLVATDPESATALYGRPAVARIGFSSHWTTEDCEYTLRELTRDPAGAQARGLDVAIANAEAVIIAGGGNMNAQFRHHIYERLVLARLAQRHGTPLIATSQTIGPELSPRDRELLYEIICGATAFGVRDDHSYRLAHHLGGAAARIYRTADDGILLQPRDVDFQAARALAPAGRYVVASFTADAGNSSISRHDYLDLVAQTLDELAVDLDAEILLVPHVGSLDGPVAKVDELSDRSIVERSTSDRITALAPMTAREVVALTAGAILSVSTRYHPLVFGGATGTPSIGITTSLYSSVRMRGAMEPLGLEPFIIPATAWQCVVPAARELSERAEEYQDWVASRSRQRRDQQEAWWDRIAGRIPDEPPIDQTAAAEQFPTIGTWAATAAQALTAFDESQASDVTAHPERARNASLPAQLRRVARRLADPRNFLRKIAGGRRNDIKERIPATPLLSVIIPAYNVERYLETCLNSVVSQTLTDMEIIVIDDGSSDGSADIAAEFAARDSRIQSYRQANRGLGAVRNRGLTLASGTYVTFVDSDDVVPRTAFDTLVNALEASGSDVAVGAVTRLLPDGSTRMPAWSRDLHEHDRQTSLNRMPSLLRDFYTWNKVYRHDFWRRHGFRFREGVLFEDQPTITEILVRADSIYVLAQTTYHWRIREDDSSLTGNMYSLRDITARHTAVNLTAGCLQKLAVNSDIIQWWRWSLVQYHFPAYIKATVETSGSVEYKAVVEMIRDVITAENVRTLEGVSAAQRVLVYLALSGAQRDVARYLEAGGTSASNVPLQQVNEQTFALLPFHDGQHSNALPADLFRVSPHEQRLVAVLTDHEWNELGQLIVRARIGLSHTLTGQDLEVRAFLTSADGHIRVPIPISGELTAATELPRVHGVGLWYHAAIHVDTVALRSEHEQILRQGMPIYLTAETRQLERSGGLNRRDSATAARLTGSVMPGGNETLALSWSRSRGLQLRLHTRAVAVTVLVHGAGRLDIDLRVSSETYDPVFILMKTRGKPERRFMLRRIDAGHYAASVDVDWIDADDTVQVSVVDDHGARRRAHAPAGIAITGDTGISATTTPAGQLRLGRRPELI